MTNQLLCPRSNEHPYAHARVTHGNSHAILRIFGVGHHNKVCSRTICGVAAAIFCPSGKPAGPKRDKTGPKRDKIGVFFPSPVRPRILRGSDGKGLSLGTAGGIQAGTACGKSAPICIPFGSRFIPFWYRFIPFGSVLSRLGPAVNARQRCAQGAVVVLLFCGTRLSVPPLVQFPPQVCEGARHCLLQTFQGPTRSAPFTI